MLIELIGYFGSLLVVVAMLMTSVKTLRIVNTVGSAIFTCYALIIHSYPTAFMNICLIIINIVNLIKLFKAEKTYSVIECYKDESIVQLYLRENLSDISKFFPEFSPEAGGHALTFIVCTGPVPIGIAIGNLIDDKTIALELDYTTASYRDFSVAKFLHKYLAEKWNIEQIIFEGKLSATDTYLEKMNFKKTESGYVKALS